MRKLFLVAILWLVGSKGFGQGYAPDVAASQMTVAEGLQVRLVASEPLVRQPVCIEFDDRGRLWVIQYLQYPNPEGLNRTQVDRYSRTVYDRIPEPPPRGPVGADRITILSDTNHDGVMDAGRDFVAGLNLASGMAFGHGGVYVLNVPYLLFYPDRNRDDRPDSDPEVLLSGFGMQDAHSVANSLTWGPDGWLYGCQGSTVTSNIRGIEFQQGVWRYHPRTQAFELFCEGGGNAWGLDFDADGQLLYSTNYGGYVLVHGVQGGNYVKSFAKHGQLHNPYAYGYFEHAPHKQFLGGHVTVGGIVYQSSALADKFRGKYIAGDLLGHAAYFHQLVPSGSTFRTETVGQLLDSRDTWFAPTDLTIGPDGAIYLADWHDARTAHPDPDAQWDRRNGRIYRVSSAGEQTQWAIPADLATASDDVLVQMHAGDDQFQVRRARQELVRRDAKQLLPQLLEIVLKSPSQNQAREVFWTYLSLQDPNAEGSRHFLAHASQLLHSPQAVIRYWTVRWLGDCSLVAAESVSAELAHQLDSLAETEPAVHVRSQLASTTARLPAHQALPIINANINRDVDGTDSFLPLQWWWAVEKHSVSGREEVMKRFVRPGLWKSRLGRDVLLTRLIRRYMAEGTSDGLDCVVRLLHAAPDDAARDALWPHMLLGWQEVPAAARSSRDALAAQHPLARLVQAAWQARPAPALARLAIALGNDQPRHLAIQVASDPSSSLDQKLVAIQLLADHPDVSMLKPLLELYTSHAADKVRMAALQALSKLNDLEVAQAIIEQLRSGSKVSSSQREQEYAALFSRREWAWLWLHAIQRRELSQEAVSLEQVRRLALLEDEGIQQAVTNLWGKLSGATPEEKLAEVRRLNNDLRAAHGDGASGRLIFKKHCAACHRLHGEGANVGPELTSANRHDRDFLLVSLVDPSSVIRKEYMSFIIRTNDDRIVTGVPVPAAEGQMKLIDSKGESIELAKEEIAEAKPSSVSIMPEGLYKQLSPQELRDLFAYLAQ